MSATKRLTVLGLALTMIAVITLPGICLSFQLNAQYNNNNNDAGNYFRASGENDRGRIGFKNNNSNDNQFKSTSLVDRMSRQVATMAAASFIFFSAGASATVIGPVPPAFADTTTVSTTTTTDATATATPEKQRESMLLKEVSAEEMSLRAKESTKGEFSSSVIDEVWNLLNKYYIERTFNSQDWNAVRAKVESKGEKVRYDDNKSMKIVTEMVQSLGDKYTRILDKDQYTAIQKYDLIGVGVALMPNAQKDIIVGAPPIAGSASDKADLKMGDVVTAVNGIPTRGRNAFDIIDQIGENPNAKQISFSILRDKRPSTIDSIGNPQSSKTFVVTMERQTMEVKDPVQYKISETRSDGTST